MLLWPNMKKADIEHLGTLARIAVTPSEVEALSHDVDAVLAYVSTINELQLDTTTPSGTAVENIMRPDKVTNEPGSYTDTLLAAAPHSKDGYVVVPKILNPDA